VSDKGVESFTPLGRAVYITGITEVLETGEVFFDLEFDFNGRLVQLTIPRGHLKRSALINYSAQGMDALEHTVTTLIEFLQMQEMNIEPTTGHIRVGWDTFVDDDGKQQPFFKGYKAIGYDSYYLGDLNIKPTGGKIGKYRDLVNEHILGTPLELAVAVGLAAVLVGFIGSEVDCANLFVHVFGDSSSGKTTFGVVAVAMGSKPDFRGQTLMRRFNSTQNALLQSLVGNTGLPTCFDEAKEAKKTDFSSLIYALESGTEKMRMAKDTVRSVGEYRTSITTTGEFSLTSDDSERAAGKEIRVQQFGSIMWTKDATSSEAIKGFFRRNYGLPCVLLAKHLLKIGKDAAIECFERNRRTFIEHSEVKDTFTERLSIKYGMILATVELANKAMDFKLSYEEILKMLVYNEQATAETRDLAQSACEYVLGQAIIHQKNFSYMTYFGSKPEIHPTVHRDTWGLRVTHTPPKVINEKKCYETVYIQTDIMTEMLRKGNFKDTSVIIKQWKDRGLLDFEVGRNTRHRKISPSGNKVHVYGVRVFDKPKKDPSEKDNIVVVASLEEM